MLLQADRARFADRDGVVHLNDAHSLVRAGVNIKNCEIVGVQVWGGDVDLDPDPVSLHSVGRRAHAHFQRGIWFGAHTFATISSIKYAGLLAKFH